MGVQEMLISTAITISSSLEIAWYRISQSVSGRPATYSDTGDGDLLGSGIRILLSNPKILGTPGGLGVIHFQSDDQKGNTLQAIQPDRYFQTAKVIPEYQI